MYIGDFLKKVFKKGNTTILIYFFINMLIVVGIIALCFVNVNIGIGIAVGIGLYAVSVFISLSPFGEWMRRRQLHCISLKKKSAAGVCGHAFDQRGIQPGQKRKSGTCG